MCQRVTEQIKPDRPPTTKHSVQGSGLFRREAGKWLHKLVRAMPCRTGTMWLRILKEVAFTRKKGHVTHSTLSSD